jgi:hypothetical protein
MLHILSTLNFAFAAAGTMPWLMKAEPDSRIVKGKDVKVGWRETEPAESLATGFR